MASKSAILAVKIIGDADKAISALGKTGVAAGAMGAAVVAGGVIAGKALYDVGAVFDGVSDTIAVGTGASGEALDGMVESAKNVGKQVPVDFETAGDAIASLNTYLGATGKPLEDMTANVLEASRMLGEDGATNADAFGRAMTQWQRPAEDGADVMDTLFLSTQKYGLGLDAQIGHLNTYGSVLQNAGFTMEEAASLFGQLESGGISVSRVMPGLNKSFRDWASEGKDVQSELLGTVDAIKEAESGTEALSIATDVFGAEGAQRMTTAIRNGTFDLEDMAGALDGATGSIAATSAETMSAGEHWTLLVNNVMAALEPLASIVFDLVGDAFGALADWVQTIDFTPLESFATMLGDMLPGLATGFLNLVSGATPLTGILDAAKNAFFAIAPALQSFLPALISFGQSVIPVIIGAVQAMIPIIMQVASVAIPAILGIVQQALPIIQNIIGAVIPAVIGAVQTLVPTILSLVPPLMSIVNTILSVLGPAIDWLLPLVTGIFGAIVTHVQGAIQIVTAIITSVAALLRGDFSGAWQALGGVVTGVMTMVRGTIQQALAWVTAFTGKSIGNIKATFTNGFTQVRSRVSSIISGLVSAVTGFIGNLVSGIRSRVTQIRTTISNGFNAARTLAVTAFTRLVTGVTGRITSLINHVRRIPSRIKSGLGNLGNLLRSAGRDLIRGMINGIGSMASALRNKASNLAGGAVNAIKQKLGIASPSKVLTTIGMQTGEGLVIGIERMQRNAARAMTGLVTVPDVPEIPLSARAAGGAGTRGGDTYIDVKLSGVVGDRDAVRRTIEDAIKEAARRTGSAGLGSRVMVA